MKRVVYLVLIVSMCLTACGSNGNNATGVENIENVETSASSENDYVFRGIGNMVVTIDKVDFKLRSNFQDVINSDRWKMVESAIGIKYDEDYLVPCSGSSGYSYTESVNFVCDDYSDEASINLRLMNPNKDKDTPLKDCVVTRIGVSTSWVNRDNDYRIPRASIDGVIELEDSIEHCKEVLGEPDIEEESSNFVYLYYIDKGNSDIVLTLEFKGNFGLVGFSLEGTNNPSLDY